MSTLSFFLAKRAYRASGPIVELDWQYFETNQDLLLTISNTGRGDITVAKLESFIIRREITSRSGKAYAAEETTIRELPQDEWFITQDGVDFPVRLASNSMVSVKVKKRCRPSSSIAVSVR